MDFKDFLCFAIFVLLCCAWLYGPVTAMLSAVGAIATIYVLEKTL